MEKWRTACAEAKAVGQQPPEKPVERQVYKLVEDGVDENGMFKYKKVAGKRVSTAVAARRDEQFYRSMPLTQERSRGKRFALTGRLWIEPPGPDLKPFHGTREELAAEAKIRPKSVAF